MKHHHSSPLAVRYYIVPTIQECFLKCGARFVCTCNRCYLNARRQAMVEAQEENELLRYQQPHSTNIMHESDQEDDIAHKDEIQSHNQCGGETLRFRSDSTGSSKSVNAARNTSNSQIDGESLEEGQ